MNELVKAAVGEMGAIALVVMAVGFLVYLALRQVLTKDLEEKKDELRGATDQGLVQLKAQQDRYLEKEKDRLKKETDGELERLKDELRSTTELELERLRAQFRREELRVAFEQGLETKQIEAAGELWSLVCELDDAFSMSVANYRTELQYRAKKDHEAVERVTAEGDAIADRIGNLRERVASTSAASRFLLADGVRQWTLEWIAGSVALAAYLTSGVPESEEFVTARDELAGRVDLGREQLLAALQRFLPSHMQHPDSFPDPNDHYPEYS